MCHCTLERMRGALGQEEWRSAIAKGYSFFLDHFFEPGGVAKYFHDRTYPIDIHSIAQALITLVALEHYDERSLPLAGEVFQWALRHMRSREGWFYLQKQALWTNRIPYMRWSQAWMLLGMAHLAGRVLAESP